MRKFSTIAIAAVTVVLAVVMAGCGKDKAPVDYSKNVIGEWHCTVDADFSAEVYVAFVENGSFELYQRLTEGRFRHYAGTWSVKGNTLSGIYADGSAWGSDYTINCPDGDTMHLTATNGSEEVMTYRREAIPQQVKDESTELRSSDIDTMRPLL